MLHYRVFLCALLLLAPAAAQGTISSLAPPSIAAGSPSFTLTVNGTGFLVSNLVQWDGSNLLTTFVSPSQLTATISASLVQAVGAHNIRVKLTPTISFFSNTVQFNVVNPVPVLNSIAPTSIVTGSTVLLAANGSGFSPTSVIRWNGTPLTTAFFSSSLISASIPAALVAVAGSASVSVQNPAPGGGTTPAQTVQIINPVPNLTGISPAAVLAGGQPFSVLGIGSGFNASSVMRLNGTPLPTTLVDATHVAAPISAALITAPIIYDITVENPPPGGGVSVVRQLQVQNPSPSVTGLVPPSVSGGGPAQTVLINGSNFIPGTFVLAAGFLLPATITPTQLSVVIPQSLLDSTTLLPIFVVNSQPGGGSSNAVLFVTGPALAGATPTFIPILTAASPPITLTVTGAGLTPTDVIRINGVPRSTTFVSGTSLTCTVDGSIPATLQPGGFALTVNRPGLVSNAVGVTVGTAAFPNNSGTITLGPVPPTPGQLFDIRVEVPITTVPLPIPSVPLTLVADTAAPSPFVISPAGMNFAVGPGLGSPIVLADGLGVFGPANLNGATTHFEDLTTFGVNVVRGVFRSPGLIAPPPLGVTVSFLAVYQNLTVPAGIGITHIGGPYTF